MASLFLGGGRQDLINIHKRRSAAVMSLAEGKREIKRSGRRNAVF